MTLAYSYVTPNMFDKNKYAKKFTILVLFKIPGRWPVCFAGWTNALEGC